MGFDAAFEASAVDVLAAREVGLQDLVEARAGRGAAVRADLAEDFVDGGGGFDIGEEGLVGRVEEV